MRKFLGDFLTVSIIVSCFKLSSTASLEETLQSYEQYVNSSLQLEKEDKFRINSWSEQMQVQLVDVTTRYRLDMTSHQLHSFRKLPANEKWQECLRLYHNSITKLEQVYYVRENECLRIASSADGEKRQAVIQVGREIRKWRRSYRYLKNKCQINNPDDEEQAGTCLVKYMERDNYSYAFQRLINLRLEVVKELHKEMTSAIRGLEECLKTTLSVYLEQVRGTKDVLRKCYGEKVV